MHNGFGGSTRQRLNREICRQRLLKKLQPEFRFWAVAVLPTFLVFLIIWIAFTSFCISAVRKFETFDIFVFFKCLGLLTGELCLLFGTILPLLCLWWMYSDIRWVKSGEFCAVEDTVNEIGRELVRCGRYTDWMSYLSFCNHGKYFSNRMAEFSSVGDKFYIISVRNKGKEQIFEVYPAKLYRWED